MKTGKSDPLQGTEYTRAGKRYHSETKTRVCGTTLHGYQIIWSW